MRVTILSAVISALAPLLASHADTVCKGVACDAGDADSTNVAAMARTHREVREYTSSDYVQDGLVALFDGVDNAGKGNHSDSARLWMNLVTGRSLSWPSNFTVEVLSNAFHITAAAAENFVDTGVVGPGADRTVEIVFRPRYALGMSIAVYVTNVGGDFLLAATPLIGPLYVYHNNRSDYIDLGTSATGVHFLTMRFYSQVSGYSNRFVITDNRSGKSTGINYANPFTPASGQSGRMRICGRRNSNDYVNMDYYCIRVYDRTLTQDEMRYNHEIDLWRLFGGPL